MSNPTPLHEREYPDWEFHPEFKKDVMPHLEDWSWHNDTKPCFVDGDTGLIIWVDHLDPKQREFPEDSYIYTLSQAEAGPVGWDHTDCPEILLETDDLSEVKQMIDDLRYESKMSDLTPSKIRRVFGNALPPTALDWWTNSSLDIQNEMIILAQREGIEEAMNFMMDESYFQKLQGEQS